MTYEKVVRSLRRHAFDEGRSPAKEQQFDRVLAKALARAAQQARVQRPSPAVGPYSGLTRRELAMSGTCEADWY